MSKVKQLYSAILLPLPEQEWEKITRAQTVVRAATIEFSTSNDGIAALYPEAVLQYKLAAKENKISFFHPLIVDSYPKRVYFMPVRRSRSEIIKISDLERALKSFRNNYKELGITSAAFPVLASKSHINRDIVINIMREYLSDLEIPAEIYCL